MWRKIKFPKIKPLSKIGVGLFTLAFLSLSVYAVHASKILMPGETSAMAPKTTPLDGFVSHSEFEKDCTHCHAPLHCVTDTKCQDCHADVALQRSQVDGVHGKLPGTEKCQTCHPEHLGRDVVITDFAYKNVDHTQMAGFNLEYHKVDYQEMPMNCESCHSQERFSNKTLDCLTCHAEEDHEMMSEHVDVYGVDCTRCHNGADRMKNFKHEEVYVLDGAHASAKCADCHNYQLTADTIQGCYSCHEDPELHAGQFGVDCARCHTATAWQPAMLTKHTFILDHGGTKISECHTCHTDTFAVKTCYNCHDHQPADIVKVHEEEGLAEYENCAQCHPSGKEGEAAELLRLYGDFSLMPDSQVEMNAQSTSPMSEKPLKSAVKGQEKPIIPATNPIILVNQGGRTP